MPLFEALGLALVPKSARIESSGGHFGTQGADFEKKGPKMDPILAKIGQISLCRRSFFMVLEPPGVPKASQNTHGLIINDC